MKALYQWKCLSYTRWHTTEATRETPTEAVCKPVLQIAFANDSSYTCVEYADLKQIGQVGFLELHLTLDHHIRHIRLQESSIQ